MFKRFATLFAHYKEFEKWRKYAGTCAIGDILLNEMDDPKSPNYIELIFTDKDGKEQAIVTVVRASGKTPAKMLEEANERLDLAENSLKAAGFTQASPSNQWKPPVGPSASPLLQRIDDLSAQRDELLALANNFQITGPDEEGLVWLSLHGNGTTGKAMFNLGSADRLAAQVAMHLEVERQSAIAGGCAA